MDAAAPPGIIGDLLDRSILLYLPPIRDGGRRDEETFWAEFRRARPWLLGALLDGVSVALRRLPEVRLERLPRMADFALWVVAAAPGLGIDPEGFLAGYAHNRGQANQLALEASPVATEVLAFVADRGAWAGTAAELLSALNGRVPEEARRARGWPKAANALSGALRRVQPNLTKAGVVIDFKREATRRWIELEWVSAGLSPSSHRHQEAPEQGKYGDDAGDDGKADDGPADGHPAVPEETSSSPRALPDQRKQMSGDGHDDGDGLSPTRSDRRPAGGVRCPACGVEAQFDPATDYGRRRLDEGHLECAAAWEAAS